jgi:hypothetical protein
VARLLPGGRVRYLRTHDHSTMGIATGSAETSTHVDFPADLQPVQRLPHLIQRDRAGHLAQTANRAAVAVTQFDDFLPAGGDQQVR